MARKPRLHYTGACYHVILRGNARQDVFFNDADRYRFYLFIQEGIERFGYRVHGFCLMTNHVHIALQVGETPLSMIMQNLCSRYTRWVNWRLNRIGHLFHGRYKAVIIEADSYLTQLVGYIHLNPVRARMVERCEDYEWSSHRTYVGASLIPWLTTQTVLSQFSEITDVARRLFQDFVAANSGEGHRAEFHGANGFDSRIFGEDRFVDEVLYKAEARPLKKADIHFVLATVGKLYEIEIEDLSKPGQDRRLSEARSMAAWGIKEMSSSTLTELSLRIGRDITSLSSGAKRLHTRARSDSKLAARMADFKGLLEEVAKLQT